MIVELLHDEDLYVLWASMISMVGDDHSPRDELTEDQWVRAEILCDRLDAEYNLRARAGAYRRNRDD
jgi:hypothetical protein